MFMTLLSLLLVMLAACADKASVNRYPMTGEIKALNPTAHSATIAAGKIGDWMEAMEADADALVNTVNCGGILGRGLAAGATTRELRISDPD
jgi:hypothetical protein